MNVLYPFQPTPGVTEAQTDNDLASFRAKSTAATVWHRPMPRDVLGWLDTIDPSRLPSGRVIVQASGIGAVVSQLCDISNLPKGDNRDWLEQDIATLASTFASLMETDYLRLRLAAVTTNACRRFHVDTITGRLVCTYRGTGTQYGISDRGDDPQAIFTVATGSPILMRGKLWPAFPDHGVVHRSPPIEGSGETRLVLVLDPVEANEAERDVYLTQ